MATPSIPNGRQIKTARELRGWSQKRLIEELVRHGYRPITQTTFSAYENTRAVPRLMLGPLLRAMPELAPEPTGQAIAS